MSSGSDSSSERPPKRKRDFSKDGDDDDDDQKESSDESSTISKPGLEQESKTVNFNTDFSFGSCIFLSFVPRDVLFKSCVTLLNKYAYDPKNTMSFDTKAIPDSWRIEVLLTPFGCQSTTFNLLLMNEKENCVRVKIEYEREDYESAVKPVWKYLSKSLVYMHKHSASVSDNGQLFKPDIASFIAPTPESIASEFNRFLKVVLKTEINLY